MNKNIPDEELEKVSGGIGNNPNKERKLKQVFSFDEAAKSSKSYSPRASEGYPCQKS